MKRLMILAAAIFAAGGTAKAADIFTPKDAYVGDVQTYNFTGIGIGINGGGQFTNVNLEDGGFEFDGIGADGLVGGIHVEWLARSDRFRFGPTAECALSNVNTTIKAGGGEVDLLQMDNYCNIGLKAGVMASDATLIYGRAAYEWQNWTASNGVDEVNTDSTAWLLGGGLETMVADHLSVGFEGNYLFTDSVDVKDNPGVGNIFDGSEHFRGIARLTYRY